ncbi:CRIB domain-containing protein RIC6-like [Forsythia ovata]|uniref:CRIB domain-containing protein RIC6-like n=1 Tax=Forsythia ovata TaxID=205694 RepID=A0ABD1X4K7_9LAMI
MSTKMKGLLKGLRYISQIFEEEKEAEMQIGNPTDVKHVAHIGWDGPSVDNPPSWMKEFKPPTGGFQSAPLGSPGDSIEEGDHEIKWVSEDSRRGSRDLPELPKSSRRHTSSDGANDSPKRKDGSTSRSRQSRRHSKDSSDSVRSNRQNKEGESTSGNLPDIPKKSRRKKSKESISVGSTRSRFKASDPRPDIESILPRTEQ